MKNILRVVLIAATFSLTLPTLAATCSAGANCRACKNCSACANCSKRGGTCSVCRPDKYRSATPPAQGTQSTPPASRNQRQSARNVAVPAKWSGKVVGVSDGDTATVMYGSTPVRVRLNGIDAPESRQAFGTQAKSYLSSLVFGKAVVVTNQGMDRYGRVLGQINVGNIDVNASMVNGGYAWWYRQYARNRTDLEKYEAQARTNKRGLWRDGNPIAPWEWRRGRKVSHRTQR